MKCAKKQSEDPAKDMCSLYAELFDTGFFVFDERAPYFQEKVLQVIWNEQLLNRTLHTVDGMTLKVIHPGTWNVESGPDFRDAVIAFNGRSHHGAVEIHRRPEDWRRHGHDRGKHGAFCRCGQRPVGQRQRHRCRRHACG